MGMVRSMLSYSSFPLGLWMETLKTAIHLLNRVYQVINTHDSIWVVDWKKAYIKTIYIFGAIQLKQEYLILDKNN